MRNIILILSLTIVGGIANATEPVFKLWDASKELGHKSAESLELTEKDIEVLTSKRWCNEAYHTVQLVFQSEIDSATKKIKIKRFDTYDNELKPDGSTYLTGDFNQFGNKGLFEMYSGDNIWDGYPISERAKIRKNAIANEGFDPNERESVSTSLQIKGITPNYIVVSLGLFFSNTNSRGSETSKRPSTEYVLYSCK